MQYDRDSDTTATLSHVQFEVDAHRKQSPHASMPEPYVHRHVGLLAEHLNEMSNVLIARRRLGLRLSDLKPQLRSMAYAVDLLYEVIEAGEPCLSGKFNVEGAVSGRFVVKDMDK